MKISLLTLGCKTNQAETDLLEAQLKQSGHEVVPEQEKADLCVINTCTVTAKADYQSRQLVRRALKNNSKVIVTGCYAQLNPEKISAIGADLMIVNNVEKDSIIDLIAEKAETAVTASTITLTNQTDKSTRHRPIVKVQDGCNYSCSYCAIPAARGKSRSFNSQAIVNRIRDIQQAGYKEVVLTGIHLGTYGSDFNEPKSLSWLLQTILKETANIRIRLSSLEIREIDELLLELLRDRRVCNHLHVPLQSGDDRVLRLMNRMYRVGDFVTGVEKVASRHPGISIGTDVIVGFPNEGADEFNNTFKVIETLPLSYLHVFPYSGRPGTKALNFKEQIDDNTKKRRAAELRSLSKKKKNAYIRSLLGTVVEVVTEERTEKGLLGTSSNYIKVLIDHSEGIKAGELVEVELVEYWPDSGLTVAKISSTH